MSNYLNLKFWFNLRPNALDGLNQKYFIMIVAILLIATIISAIVKTKNISLYNKIWRKLNTFFLTNSIIGLLLLFFTYELVPFLSARFWFLLLALGNLVWIYFIGKEFIKIPKIKEEIAREKEFKKYIP